MSRSHVSEHAGPIAVEPRSQDAKPAMKPKGFWYEVNAGWRQWCADEMPGWVQGRYLHRVTIGDERMLTIRTVGDLDAFVSGFHVSKHVSGRWYSGPLDLGIAWERVAASWDGIEIAPYQWERRLDGPIWYYTWDCASGVIWRPSGVSVQRVRRLPEPPR